MSSSLIVVAMLSGLQGLGYGTYFAHLYLPTIKSIRLEKSKKDLPLNVIITRHARGDFSDELDEEPKPIEEKKKSNLKSHAIFTAIQALALTATSLVYVSGQNGELPSSLKPYDNGDNVLTDKECWELIHRIDRNKDNKYQWRESLEIERLINSIGGWTENESKSRSNLEKAYGTVLYLDGNIPAKVMRE